MAKDDKSTHYDAGGVEVLDVIKAKLTPEQYQGYLLGNTIKYVLRANFKGTFGRDMEKAANYAKWLGELDLVEVRDSSVANRIEKDFKKEQEKTHPLLEGVFPSPPVKEMTCDNCKWKGIRCMTEAGGFCTNVERWEAKV